MLLPTDSRLKVFTTHDVDNIDSKSQGSFSLDEFRGYALSVTNHVSSDNLGEQRAHITLDPSYASTPKLPDTYLIQPSIRLSQSDVSVPKLVENEIRPDLDVRCAMQKDESWMAHVSRVLNKDKLADDDVITWSGYNSLLAGDESVKPPAVIGVYPLFPDKAATASSMKHAMDLTLQGTEFFNPGQISVLGADQPLFAIIKLLQWQFP